MPRPGPAPDTSSPRRAWQRWGSRCGALRPQPAHVRIGSASGVRVLPFAVGTGIEDVALGAVVALEGRLEPGASGHVDRRVDGCGLGLLDPRVAVLVRVGSARGRLDRDAAERVVVHALRSRAAAFERLVRAGDDRVPRSGGRRIDRVRRDLELGLRLDDLLRCAVRELLVRLHAAVLRSRERRIRAALAVGEDRRAAAGEVLALLAVGTAEGRLRLLLGELAVGDDVDLPPGEAVREPRVHALLADRERELVVRSDDGGLARLVVEVDLANARRRERLRHEPRGLGVPRDDVDLLAAQLGDAHPDARAARADARPDGVDALSVRLDGDLRPVARLACDAADLDEAVGDLGHLELEKRLDQLGVAARQDHLRALRSGSNLGDDGLDARALLVALAVDLLRARQQRLDLAEVDEHVVAVTGLLHDARDDFRLAVLVLVVHHHPLRFADALQDHLLGSLSRDAAEVLGRDVLTLDLLGGYVGPVDVEVIVGEQRVRTLAVLRLDSLELLERALTRLVEEALLDVGRKLDRIDAKVALVV